MPGGYRWFRGGGGIPPSPYFPPRAPMHLTPPVATPLVQSPGAGAKPL